MEKIRIKKDSRVVFLGDSISDPKFNFQFSRKIKGRNIYALQLKKKLKRYSKNIKVDIKGIASNRTYHVYDRLTKDCINLKPDVIIMLIGVNDAWENYGPENYPPLLRPMEPHMKEIYRRINAELPETQVLYLMPFLIDAVEEKLPFHKMLDEFREVLKRLALENGAKVLDLQEVFNEAQKTIEPVKLAVDGIHPTNLGHRLMADAIENDRLINVYGGGGHTTLPVGEMFFRAGGLSCINPLMETGLSVFNQALKYLELERTVNYGSAIIKYYNLKKDDVLIIFHNIGINPATIDAAMEAKKTPGAWVNVK